MQWITEIINLFCTLFAFIYGACVSFKRTGILFVQIVTCAFGCFLLESLYNLCYFVCIGSKVNGSFNIGSLGYIGGMFFLLSSYYGAMDRIGDSKSKNLRKYRLFSLVISTLNAVFCIYFILKRDLNIFLLLSVLLSSIVLYFSFKHLILPDIEGGILRAMRRYNLLISMLCIGKNLCYVLRLYKNDGYLYLNVIVCVITVIALPIANRGVKKWST